jgi:hypothetical protein
MFWSKMRDIELWKNCGDEIGSVEMKSLCLNNCENMGCYNNLNVWKYRLSQTTQKYMNMSCCDKHKYEYLWIVMIVAKECDLVWVNCYGQKNACVYYGC